MNFTTFLHNFLLITIIGTLAVTGWFFITRGSKELQPDGTYKEKGKIFKNWLFFWTKTKAENKKIFYKGFALQSVVDEINTNHPNLGLTVRVFDYVHINNDTIYRSENQIKNILAAAGGLKLADYSGNTFTVYKDEVDFVFPWWVRDPLAVCATCFASIYGTIFYWGVILNVPELFAWAPHIWFAKIFYWVAFCLSLAVLNTALAKKFN